MLELLSPLDYPRRSLANLVRGGGRLLGGEGSLSDALGMLPGAAGLGVGALTMNPWLGVGAAAGLQGLGALSGLEGFDAPTTGDVVDLVGGDRESFLQNALAQVATDPLTYSGLLSGGRAAHRLMSGAGQVGGEVDSLGAIRSLSEAQNPPMPPRTLIGASEAERLMNPMGEFPRLPEVTGPPVYLDFPVMEHPEALATGGHEVIRAPVGRPELPPPPLNSLGVGGPALPPVPEPPPGPYTTRSLREYEEGLRAAAREYRAQAPQRAYQGQVGMTNDAMTDMLAQGYATPQQRLGVANMTDDLLTQAGDLRSGMGGGLPPLTTQELSALRMRESLAHAEADAALFTPSSLGKPVDWEALHEAYDFNRLGNMASEQTGWNGNDRGLADLIRRGIGGRSEYPGDLAVGLADAPFADQVHRHAQMVADARLASPELRLADQMRQEMRGLGNGTLSPEQAAQAVARARQYGLPIEPQMVLENYAGQLPRNLTGQIPSFEVDRQYLGAAEPFVPGQGPYLDDSEATLHQYGGELLRLLGPQGMQRLSQAPEAMLTGPGLVPTAKKTSASLTRALEEALRARGFRVGGAEAGLY